MPGSLMGSVSGSRRSARASSSTSAGPCIVTSSSESIEMAVAATRLAWSVARCPIACTSYCSANKASASSLGVQPESADGALSGELPRARELERGFARCKAAPSCSTTGGGRLRLLGLVCVNSDEIPWGAWETPLPAIRCRII